MGSGKTSVGRALAQQLGWRFADLDEVVHQAEGLSVPEIFAQKGEPFFRTAEIRALDQLLHQDRVVIALGGGAPETSELRALLQSASGTAVIHLHAPFEILYRRCVLQAEDPDATSRPLLGAWGAAAERYTRRLPLYAAIAHHTADVSEGSAQRIAEMLLRHFQDQIA